MMVMMMMIVMLRDQAAAVLVLDVHTRRQHMSSCVYVLDGYGVVVHGVAGQRHERHAVTLHALAGWLCLRRPLGRLGGRTEALQRKPQLLRHLRTHGLLEAEA